MPSLKTRFSRAFAAFKSNETGETPAEVDHRARATVGCYVLEISKGGPALLNDPQKPDHFAKKYIGLDRTTQSVFQASSDIEEIEAPAALLHAERMWADQSFATDYDSYPGDFAGLPITLNHTPIHGDTGIYRVDRRHFDLESDSAGYIKLMEILIDRLQAGEHRIRHAGTHQIALMVRIFWSWAMTQSTKKRKPDA